MAGADGMTIEEVVIKALLDEHADVIREAIKASARSRPVAWCRSGSDGTWFRPPWR